jgi:hypothetical protein
VSRGHGERGQTTVLVVGLFLVALGLVVVVVDASAAYLRREALDGVADGAALAATEGASGREVYDGTLGERARIDPGAARQAVAGYLAATGAVRRYPGLEWSVDTTPDRVVVRLRAPLDLPLVPPGWGRDATVGATAAAYVAVSR